MEELIQFCESEAMSLDHQMAHGYYQFPGSNYTSVITFDGRPILPPLLTETKRQEMLMYKHQAIMIENRLKARIRQQLLAKVQAVMKEIEAKEKAASLAGGGPGELYQALEDHNQSESNEQSNRSCTEPAAAEQVELPGTPEMTVQLIEQVGQQITEQLEMKISETVKLLANQQVEPEVRAVETYAIEEVVPPAIKDMVPEIKQLEQCETHATPGVEVQVTYQVNPQSTQEVSTQFIEDAWLERKELEQQAIKQVEPQTTYLLETQTPHDVEPQTIPELMIPSSLHVETDDNVPSQRTATDDSGVFSKCPTTSECNNNNYQTFDPSTQGQAVDRLATLTDVADISSEDEKVSEAETEATTIERRGATVFAQERDSSSTEELSYESQESYHDAVLKFDVEVVDKTENDPTADQSDHCTQENSIRSPPLGSKERVEQLVKKLDSALKYHEKQRASTSMGLSLQSTNSSTASATTLSSSEQNLTVIAWPKVIHEGDFPDNESGTLEIEPNTNSIPRDRRDTMETDSNAESIPQDQRDTTETESNAESIPHDGIDTTETGSNTSSIPQDQRDTMEMESNVGCIPRERRDTIDTQSTADIDTNNVSSEADREEPGNDDAQLNDEDTNVVTDSGNHEIPEITDLESSLLSRVVLDTPDETSEDLSEHESSQSRLCSVQQEMISSTQTVIEVLMTSPGPTQTPDLSHISHVPENSKSPISAAVKLGGNLHKLKHSTDISAISPPADPQMNKSQTSKSQSPGDPFVHSTDTSQLYTASTELAPYMIQSMDTNPSSQTTLSYNQEHGQNNSSAATESPYGSSLPYNSQPSSLEKSAKLLESGSTEKPHVERVRKDSYTLDHPSPMLVAAHAKKSQKSPTEGATELQSQLKTKPFNLTSSMEDLKLKPGQQVQRRLDYVSATEQPKPILKKTTPIPPELNSQGPAVVHMDSKEGKEEHLHRYLQHLSQMPTFQDQVEAQTYQDPVDTVAYHNTSSQMANPPCFLGNQNCHLAVRMSADVESLGHISQEDLVTLQMQYFEMMRQQMLGQQQQQLAQLFAEQERQQLLLQQELLQQQLKLPQASQKQQRTNPKLQKNARNMHYVQVQQSHESQLTNSDLLNRPYSAPVQRVSFAPTPEHAHHCNSKSPSGVYCNQSFPISPQNGLQMDTSVDKSQQEVLDSSYQSPAVLRYSAPSLPVQRAHSQPKQYSHYSPTRGQVCDQTVYQQVSTSAPSGHGQHIHQVLLIQHQDLPQSLQKKFNKLSAAVKGFLTRKLMKTDKVQHLINTIKDTAEFALNFQQETPIKKGIYSHQDKNLLDRVLTQLTAAMYDFHDIFFETTLLQRMAIIHQSRLMEHEKIFKQGQSLDISSKRLSTATRKAMERKRRAKAAEAIVFGHMRPTSCPPNTSSPKAFRDMDLSGPIKRNYHAMMMKALKPIQAQLSPIKPNKDNKTARSEVHGQRQLSPHSKAGLVTVKRIQSRPKSATGKQVKKAGTASAVRKISRPSQHNKHSPDVGQPSSKSSRPSSQASTTRPASQASNRTTSQASNRTTSQASNRVTSQASNRVTSQASNRVTSQAESRPNSQATSRPSSQITSKVDNGRVSSRNNNTPPGTCGYLTKASSKAPHMVRHTTHSNKIRAAAAENVMNVECRDGMLMIVSPSSDVT